MKDAYIFIAKDSMEFDRYPGDEYGYFIDRNSRLPYRYRIVSRNVLIIVLDSFVEKEILKDSGDNADNYIWFWTVVFLLAEKVIRRVDKDVPVKEVKLNVFVHFGGMEMAVAEKLVGRMKLTDCLKHVSACVECGMCSDASLKIITALFHKEGNLYAISSTDPLKRLDLNAPKILLPDSEDGLKQLVGRFDHDLEKGDWGYVKRGFEKRWAIDTSSDGEKKTTFGQEYYNCCKALGIVAKEDASDE